MKESTSKAIGFKVHVQIDEFEGICSALYPYFSYIGVIALSYFMLWIFDLSILPKNVSINFNPLPHNAAFWCTKDI